MLKIEVFVWLTVNCEEESKNKRKEFNESLDC